MSGDSRSASGQVVALPAQPMFVEKRAERFWQIGAVIGLVLLVLSYLLFVQTVPGQALENAALRGADQVQSTERRQANVQLNLITVRSLAGAVVLLGLIGLWRRRLDLALASMGIVVVSLGVTQVLKRFILTRPPLVEATEQYTTNSFPSGHTTIAMAVLLALIVLSSQRWRLVTVFIGTFYALDIGAWTLTAKWHRFSDTLGAGGIVLMTACLASLWLLRRGLVQPVIEEEPRSWTRKVGLVWTALLVLGSAVTLGAGLYLADASSYAARNAAESDYISYLGLSLLASASSVFIALLFWRSWKGLEVKT